MASQLIPGMPWCVVWTGDEKVFYFNPTTKVSVWEKPEELVDNDNVNEILEAGPEKKAPSKCCHIFSCDMILLYINIYIHYIYSANTF